MGERPRIHEKEPRMLSIDLHELEANIGDVVRRVREQGETIAVLDQGTVVLRLVPEPEPPPVHPDAEVWADIDRLAAEIGAHWPEGVTAVDAVREGRREL